MCTNKAGYGDNAPVFVFLTRSLGDKHKEAGRKGTGMTGVDRQTSGRGWTWQGGSLEEVEGLLRHEGNGDSERLGFSNGFV